MKRTLVVLTMMLCGLILAGTSSALAQKKMKKMAVTMATEDLKWEEMKGGPPGIMYCNLWGDMMKGAYGAMVKLPANMQNPLHSHSSDTKAVVVAGSFYMTPEGGAEKVLGAGSYFMEPGGVKHMSGTKDQGATLFQEGTSKFDMKMVEMPKEKK